VQVIETITAGFKKYTKADQAHITKVIIGATDAWLYSKLQATQLINIVEGIRDSEKRNQLVEDLYLYASSQSKYSAAYYKLE